MENPVRITTLEVVKNAKDVKINRDKIKKLAEDWIKNGIENSFWPEDFHLQTKDPQKLLDYLIILDALNFCFWPARIATRSVAGGSKKQRWQIDYSGNKYNGYYALALALKKFFEEQPEKANLDYLSNISFLEFKDIFQGGKNLLFLKKRWQIVRLVARSIVKNYVNSVDFVKSAENKFSILTRKIYKELPGFNDIVYYPKKKVYPVKSAKGGVLPKAKQFNRVYLLKRAQILCSEIWGAFAGKGMGYFKDLDYLTCFPDYKIPQILNSLGILEYSERLDKKIKNKVLIPMGSSQEIEIRSATVQSVEILKNELRARGKDIPAFQLDWILWNKSKKDKMKNHYHLTKTIFY